MAVKLGKMSKGGIKSTSHGKSKARGNAGNKYVTKTLKTSIKKAFGKPGMRQPRWQGTKGDGATGKSVR